MIAEKIVFVDAVLVPNLAVPSATPSTAFTPSASYAVGSAEPTAPPVAPAPWSSTAPGEAQPGPPVVSTPTTGAPIAYLPFDAVDTPATPVGDWLIDADALPRYTEVRLVLRLWISATGVLDRWEVTDQTIAPELAARILADLDKTPILPAVLNNVAVPSLRQLEVVLSRQ